MPILGNLGFSDFHYNSALALAIQRHEATVTQDGGSDVRKCLIFPPPGDFPVEWDASRSTWNLVPAYQL